ncbi:MAG TPA: adenosylcobinamide-GDP ribazoletransferase [Roseateles sp.]|nr:adenosylcobinamide-GDP ribazoletransferase [Roseateles sp.]HWT53847.1 adenosylcobinamide-GDP ribazoletransferase [Rhodocyclaceae bacterium]
MRAQLEYFFAALRFFTRLPVPAWVGHSEAQLNRATRYFPLIGWIVGLIGAAVTWAAAWVLPLSIAVLLGMAATLLTTGAFHEDGFADSCDGFGGGWSKEDVLRIMKDSRIGSYGAIGIGVLLLTKWNALYELDDRVLSALVAAHPISRAAATTLIYALDYVRDEDGKSKPLAVRIGGGELAMAWLFGLLPTALLGWLLSWQLALQAVLAVVAVTVLMAAYTRRRIGGYTGDVLGATQQLAEVFFYLGLLCAFS